MVNNCYLSMCAGLCTQRATQASYLVFYSDTQTMCGAQQYRALMMILQSHRTQTTPWHHSCVIIYKPSDPHRFLDWSCVASFPGLFPPTRISSVLVITPHRVYWLVCMHRCPRVHSIQGQSACIPPKPIMRCYD